MNSSANNPCATVGIAIMICLSLLFSGCTSTRFHSASQGAKIPTAVRAGDKVNCIMNDGTQKAFTVTVVEPTALVGEAVRLPIADISSVAVTRFDGKKTVLQTGKVVGVVILGTAVLAGMGLAGLALR